MSESAWQRRNRLAREQGFRNARDKAEYNRLQLGRPAYRRPNPNARANALGFATDYQLRRFRKTNPGVDATAPTPAKESFTAADAVKRKAQLLKKFGVTEQEFNRRNKLNAAWQSKEARRRTRGKNRDDSGANRSMANFLSASEYHTYNRQLADSGVWTEQRVGYVLFYYAANVDPSTNYSDALGGRKGKRSVNRQGFREMNAAQYYYLVQYTGLMSVNEYEASYGSAQTEEAQGTDLEDAL
jgi:hypothetical protein